MSQSYSSNCFSTANVIQDDMQNVENNFDALRSNFSGSTAPTSPDAGQWWYDTGSSMLKIRYNSSWVNVWDMDGQMVAAGQVKTNSLAAGALSTDSTGRAIMANGFIKSSHVEDVDVSKVTNLNKAQVIWSTPRAWFENTGDTAVKYDVLLTPATDTVTLGRIYIPNSGANKLKVSGMPSEGVGALTITVGTSAVSMITFSSTGVHDTSTYIDVTAWLGTLQTLQAKVTQGHLIQLTVYLTT